MATMFDEDASAETIIADALAQMLVALKMFGWSLYMLYDISFVMLTDPKSFFEALLAALPWLPWQHGAALIQLIPWPIMLIGKGLAFGYLIWFLLTVFFGYIQIMLTIRRGVHLEVDG